MPRYARHPSDFQRRLVDIEATTAHLQTFVPTVVPGLMQTEAYMRELLADLELPEEEIRAFVANRVQRQERLHHRTKRTTMLTTEGAFGWRAGSREQMAQQCERAAMVSRLPNVRVGIIPWGTRAHHFPMNGWDLHDQRAVIYGTVDATAILVEPRDVRRYVELTAAVAALAAYDHEARALLAELAQLPVTGKALRADSTLYTEGGIAQLTRGWRGSCQGSTRSGPSRGANIARSRPGRKPRPPGARHGGTPRWPSPGPGERGYWYSFGRQPRSWVSLSAIYASGV
jgi:hypothetical protein